MTDAVGSERAPGGGDGGDGKAPLTGCGVGIPRLWDDCGPDGDHGAVESEWRCKRCGEYLTGPIVTVPGGFCHPHCHVCAHCSQLLAYDEPHKWRGDQPVCDHCHKRPTSHPVAMSGESVLLWASRPPPLVFAQGAIGPHVDTSETVPNAKPGALPKHRPRAVPEQTRLDTFRLDDLQVVEKLGEGFFGAVWKVVHRGTHEAFAIKQLRHAVSRDTMAAFMKEVTLLRNLQHPNVLEFVGVFRKGLETYLMTECVESGTLRDHIKDQTKPFPWTVRLKMLWDIAEGMAYMHSLHVIHRDLKSKNCLVRSDGSTCVADMGLARLAQPRGTARMTICGSPYWMAPEILRNGHYGLLADVFSFGIIMGEVAARIRATPEEFPRTSAMGVEMDTLSALCPSSTPDGFLALLGRCCSLQPEERPAFAHVAESLNTMLERTARGLGAPQTH